MYDLRLSNCTPSETIILHYTYYLFICLIRSLKTPRRLKNEIVVFLSGQIYNDAKSFFIRRITVCLLKKQHPHNTNHSHLYYINIQVRLQQQMQRKLCANECTNKYTRNSSYIYILITRPNYQKISCLHSFYTASEYVQCNSILADAHVIIVAI